VLNLGFAAALMSALVFTAIHRDQLPERLHERRSKLTAWMRTVSLSQTWKMYAPDATKGHAYVEIIGYDKAGDPHVLEESHMVQEGWTTARAWRRSRLDIWEHTVTRHITKTNRNRTWYMRGVCVRERRRGLDIQRVELRRIFRKVRAPEKVRKGAETLGPLKRSKAQNGSCHVKIIRNMIAEDPYYRE